jgi:segregation and condensation protein B
LKKVEERYIVESALFSAGGPLEVDLIAEACELTKPMVKKCLKELIKEYKDRDGSMEVAQVGDKYAMQLRSEYAQHAAKLAQMEVPLKVLKTAALIAYYQPIPQSELKKLLGSKVYDHVHALTDLGLIRARKSGQTKILYTTPRFSEYFGIDEVSKNGIKTWLAKKVGMKEATGTLEEFFEKVGNVVVDEDEELR